MTGRPPVRPVRPVRRFSISPFAFRHTPKRQKAMWPRDESSGDRCRSKIKAQIVLAHRQQPLSPSRRLVLPIFNQPAPPSSFRNKTAAACLAVLITASSCTVAVNCGLHADCGLQTRYTCIEGYVYPDTKASIRQSAIQRATRAAHSSDPSARVLAPFLATSTSHASAPQYLNLHQYRPVAR